MRTQTIVNSFFTESCRNINLLLYFKYCFLQYSIQLGNNNRQNPFMFKWQKLQLKQAWTKSKDWKVKCRQGWQPWPLSSSGFCSPLRLLFFSSWLFSCDKTAASSPGTHPPFTPEVTTQALGLTLTGSFGPCQSWTVTMKKKRESTDGLKPGAHVHS